MSKVNGAAGTNRRSAALLACAMALAGCRDFALAPKSAALAVDVEPPGAFGGQTLALRFSGQADPSVAQVSIGGQLASLVAGQDGAGSLSVVVPRLEGTCLQDVAVSIAVPGLTFNPATLHYLGVGHPGTPRPVLLDKTRSVDFVPTSLVYVDGEQQGTAVASSYGEAAVMFTVADLVQQSRTIYREDFILALATPSHGLLVDVMQHGQVEQVAVLADRMTSNGKVSALPADLANFLPSALSEPPSLAVLQGQYDASQTFIAYQGALVASVPTRQAFRIDRSAEELTPSLDPELTAWMSGASAQAAPFDCGAVAFFLGGTAPAARLVDLGGAEIAAAPEIDAEDAEWSVTCSAGSASGYAAGYLETSLGLDGRLLLVGFPGSGRCWQDTCSAGDACGVITPCDDGDGSGAGTCGDDGSGNCVCMMPVVASCDTVAAPECGNGNTPCKTPEGKYGNCGSDGGACVCVPNLPCALEGACAGPCAQDGANGLCMDQGMGCACYTDGDLGCADPPCSGFCMQAFQPGTCGDDASGSCGCTPSPDSPCDDSSGECRGPCTVGGQIGDCSDDGSGCACVTAPDAGVPGPRSPVLVDVPIHGAPMISMTLATESTETTLYAVDGVSSFLYSFEVTLDAQHQRMTGMTPIPLPEPGIRVAAVPSTSTAKGRGAGILVVGRSGKLYPGPSFNANRLRVGLTSLAPVLRPSCETPQAVASAGLLGATVVVPTAEGRSAFLEGAPNARFVDSVSFGRDGGAAPLAYFFSGGAPEAGDAGVGDGGSPVGFLVSQTAVQIYDLAPDGGLGKKSEFHFTARAGVAAQWGDQATLVVAAPEGIRFVGLTAGQLPGEADARLDTTCPDVRALVPLRDDAQRVVAIAAAAGGQRLCMVDTKNQAVSATDTVLPIAAAASTLDASGAAHLFSMGWETSAGVESLVLRHALVGATGAPDLKSLEWGSRALQLLPTGGAPITAMAASPDGRQLLVGFSGENPGVLAIDLTAFVPTGSEADRASALTTISLSAPPVGIGYTADGAQAVIALSDDTLAFLQ